MQAIREQSKPLEPSNRLAYVSKHGRVHLAVGPDKARMRAKGTLCGIALEGKETLKKVAKKVETDLQNFNICPNCMKFYLYGGYREFVLAKRNPSVFTIHGGATKCHRTSDQKQLQLF